MKKQNSIDEQALINSIKENLPTSSTLVYEYVDRAIQISKKYLEKVLRKYDKEDNIYLHSLRVALEVAKHCKNTSNELFYNYDPILVALLHDVIEDTPENKQDELLNDLEVFRTLGVNKVLAGIKALTNSNENLEKYGKAKYLGLKITKELFDVNIEWFLIKLIDRLDNLSSLDKVTNEMFKRNYLLETRVILNELQLANKIIPNNIFSYYNEILKILNSSKY
jgi:(p)ppGpp synthase/HD superfamily hydrolase